MEASWPSWSAPGAILDRFATAPRPKKRGPRKMKTYNLLFWGSFWLHFGHFRLKKARPKRKHRFFANRAPVYTGALILRSRGLRKRCKMSQNAPKTAKKERQEKRREKATLPAASEAPKKVDPKIQRNITVPGKRSVECSTTLGLLARL